MSRNESELEDNPTEEDTFKILVATDIHLGYAEKNLLRGQDSFTTFEEILQLAVKNEVDFLLLGGDLFHDSKPSPYCIYKCLELLRTYCLGDKPVHFEFLSDQSCNFQYQKNPIVNYEDPNLNIGLPVFSIHGNHDDPTGQQHVSALDVVSTTGLVNYFGRWNDLSQIEVRPLLLQKGETKLALYGLSHIRDERLGRLFREKKVLMKRPEGEDWFNMLVLHQNRAARGVKNFIPDDAFPDFMNLLIWGHEHDCRIEPENVGNDIFVSQPGSSVATSLSAGEAIPKKIGLLYIYREQFKMVPLPLKTVRPFIIDELLLENPNSEKYRLERASEQAIEQVKEKIEEMIEMANSKYTDSAKQPPLPLLRLKVYYFSDQQEFNAVRIGMHFTGRVANPDEIIRFFNATAKEKRNKTDIDSLNEEYERIEIGEWANCAEDLILKFFEENKDKLSILSAKGLTEAVSRFVRHGDHDAVQVMMENQFKQTLQALIQMDPDIDNVDDAIEACRLQRQGASQDEIEANVDDPVGRNKNPRIEISDSDDEVPVTSTKQSKTLRSLSILDSDEEPVVRVPTKSGRSTSSRSKASTSKQTIEDSDEEFPMPTRNTRAAATTTRGRATTRGRTSRGGGRARSSSRGKRGNFGTLDSFLE